MKWLRKLYYWSSPVFLLIRFPQSLLLSLLFSPKVSSSSCPLSYLFSSHFSLLYCHSIPSPSHSFLPSPLCSPASPTSISPLLPSQVKAKGENFTSQYWKDISSSVLPLHRAVSCLSLYDSESALTGVVNCLAQLGCDFNFLDRDGYTALHRAINNCPQR